MKVAYKSAHTNYSDVGKRNFTARTAPASNLINGNYLSQECLLRALSQHTQFNPNCIIE